MLPETWIPHRREDGELIGWIDMTVAEPQMVPIDRLGRALEPVADWFDAEEALEAIGLRFLAERYVYLGAGGAGEPREDDDGDDHHGDDQEQDGDDHDDETTHAITVRIAQVYDDRIVLTTALTDAIEDVGREIVVPFPAPAELRSLG